MSHSTTSSPEFDYTLLVLVMGLIAFGLVMMFSASYSLAYYYTDNALYFFVRQLIWTALGLVGMFVMMNINYRFWQKAAIPIVALSLASLVLVLFVGNAEGGSTRQYFGGSVQPSEFAKIAVAIYMAAWIASKGDRIKDASYGLIPFSMLIGLLVGLIAIQPDLSTSMVIVATALAMFIIAGADIVQIGILAALGLLFAFAVTQIPRFSHAEARIAIFLASFKDPLQTPSEQIRNGILALVEGGWFGKGLTASEFKHGLIPLVYTDSIFAIIGEELGVIGGLSIIGLFLFFAYRGARIAMRATDSFGALLAFGLTTWIVGQALINIAVITATFPYTGLPLPFFSYGGSSTLANLAGIGLLLNISRDGRGNLNAYSRFWRRDRRSRLSHPDGRRGAKKSSASAFARSRH